MFTALTLPEKTMLPAVREAPDLILFVRINAGDYQTLEVPNDDDTVFEAIYMDHSSTVADVASSDILK